MFVELLVLMLVIVAGLAAIAWFAIRQRQMQLWLPSYLRPCPEDLAARRDIACRVRSVLESPQAEPVDVFLAICDHYEPRCGGASHDTALARVDRWCAEYPRLFGRFRDSGGRAPQHTFFFPQDEYHPDYLDRLAELCADGWGDVHRHGLLRRDPTTGEIIYGFIHGNWALCNCRPDGRWCGVDQELTVLRETGCYADFTLPSAPTDNAPFGGRIRRQSRPVRFWIIRRVCRTSSRNCAADVCEGSLCVQV